MITVGQRYLLKQRIPNWSYVGEDSCYALAFVGQRASISLKILSASEIASAIVDSKTGEGLPSQCATFRAAKMDAAISSTRFRPSSMGR